MPSQLEMKDISKVSIADIFDIASNVLPRLAPYLRKTPLEYSDRLSKKYDASIWLKREDYQLIRSFKLRGALNKMLELGDKLREGEVVCASAGNHAQGVAYSCQLLKKKGTIFMPETTSRQKIGQVRRYGGDWVTLCLKGDTVDDALSEAEEYQRSSNHLFFIHPFDDVDIIAGQATLGLDIHKQLTFSPEYLITCVGGGGLISGLGSIFTTLHPSCKLVGVEPTGAASMQKAIDNNAVVRLEKIDSFVDGTAIAKVGHIPFNLCRQLIDQMIAVPEGHVCSTLIDMYNLDAIVVEPAGALSVAALDYLQDDIKGKHVVVVISGGNNDIARMQEIQERSLIYQGVKYYFIVNFPQRAGALREFVNEMLLETDNITMFEYTKKNNRTSGPALIGIETEQKNQLGRLKNSFQEKGFQYEHLTESSSTFRYFL